MLDAMGFPKAMKEKKLLYGTAVPIQSFLPTMANPTGWKAEKLDNGLVDLLLSTVSTPLGSFPDVVSNHCRYENYWIGR
jgi:hypothetical protein